MPKKSDAPSEKIKKPSGDLDHIKNLLVTTIGAVDKEGTIDMVDKNMKSKPNVVEESITSTILSKKKIDTVNKTEKSQTSKETVPTSKEIKPDTLKSVDESRYNQRSNLYNRSTRIEKPTEINIFKENKDISGLSGQGDDLAGITPDIFRIPSNNKRKKTRHFDY